MKNVPIDVDGITLSRRIKFQGRLIKYGGVFPVRVLRLFRLGRGRCEQRWMDEHIEVKGKVQDWGGDLIDDNLNSLTWWINKHNKYASCEAVELLNLEYQFIARNSDNQFKRSNQASKKRWIKDALYSKMPTGIRAAVYFLYRYIFRFGFMDGYHGFSFHFFQAFWYRYLVDAKVKEVKSYMKINSVGIYKSINAVLGIKIN